MKYRLIFGVETESLEDPDQIALVYLPDKAMDMESEELALWIRDNWDTDEVKPQPIVGLDDAISVIQQEAIKQKVPTEASDAIINALIDQSVTNL
jgi:hypothetical protein